MARADLLIKLVRTGSHGEHASFRQTVEALIAEERAQRHNVLADRLQENMKVNGSNGHHNGVPKSNIPEDKTRELFFEITPKRRLNDLILRDELISTCSEVIEEHSRVELLRSHGLEPRHRILLAGPPGNGKTTLAEAFASELNLPLLSIRYENLIGSFLGETSSRLRRVFDYARTYPCVLFFDEFDTVGKERGDTHETGEIKRVVSSLLLQIDALPSYVVVIAASNHPELLDRAAWRRFQVKLKLDKPSSKEINNWFTLFEKRIGNPLGYNSKSHNKSFTGFNYSELEDFMMDVIRKYVLNHEKKPINKIFAERLQQLKVAYKQE